jgi:hypothetical protein
MPVLMVEVLPIKAHKRKVKALELAGDMVVR